MTYAIIKIDLSDFSILSLDFGDKPEKKEIEDKILTDSFETKDPQLVRAIYKEGMNLMEAIKPKRIKSILIGSRHISEEAKQIVNSLM